MTDLSIAHFAIAKRALAKAFDNIKPGSTWVHRKGVRVLVLTCGLNETDLEPVVMYKEYGERGPEAVTWVRPAKEFLDGRFTFEEREVL